MPVSIRFVSIISSNNSPLYIKSFDDTEKHDEGDNTTEDSELKVQKNKELLRYHFLSHMALDYIITQLSQTETTKDYALLLVHDGVAVYGSLTNTNIKILIGTDAQEGVRFDLRTTFRSIHRAYISYVCNPFHEVNDQLPIKSKGFDKAVEHFIKAWNSAATGFM